MKMIVSNLLCAALIFSSCIQQIEEAGSIKISGIWAVVDENDMTSEFLEFKMGYINEYMSSKEYYVCDGTLWGAVHTQTQYINHYRYSIVDGVIYYNNTYNNVEAIVKREGDIMMIGDHRYLSVNDIDESYYSTIVFPESNKLQFHINEKDIEWDYTINNPVAGLELVVKEAPEWCGGAEGVTVDDGKIRFSITPSEDDQKGCFVFSYLSAKDIVIEVNMMATKIVMDETSGTYTYKAASDSFTYDIVNRLDGYELEIGSDSDWITDIKDNGGEITFSVMANTGRSRRSGKITLHYYDMSAEYCIEQAYPRTQFQMEKTSEVLTCNAGTYSFPYMIHDRLDGAELTIESDSYWITDLKDDGSTITYSVAANNDNSARSARIIMEYCGLTEEYMITQSYSRGYAFWVNSWTFTGANDRTQTVRFSPGEADKTFLMTGYAGLPDEIAITVDWDEEKQIWKIHNQNFGKMAVPSGWTGEAWLYGKDSRQSYMMLSGIPICTGMIDEDGSLVVLPFEGELPYATDGYFKVSEMFIMVYKGKDNQVYVPEQHGKYPTFPFVITPAKN